MKLYVDVDGTLVDWADNVNNNVVKLITYWKENKIGPVYVWTGGGLQYAELWRDRTGLFDGAYSKWSHKPEGDYVLVDDSPDYKYRDSTIFPCYLEGIS